MIIRQFRYTLPLLLIVFCLNSSVIAQWNSPTLLVPITVSDGVHTVIDTFGCHEMATYCIDGQLDSNLFEWELPNPPPSILDPRFVDHRRGLTGCLGSGIRLHLQEFFKTDTFLLYIAQPNTSLYPITLSWTLIGSDYTGWTALTLSDVVDGATINVDMRADSTVVIPSQSYTTIQIIGRGVVGSVEGESGTIPIEPLLSQNYPNPFNGTTTIRYYLPNRDLISLIVVDQLGRRIATIVDQVNQPGYHFTQYDAGALSSGNYFFQLKTSSSIQTKKFIFLK